MSDSIKAAHMRMNYPFGFFVMEISFLNNGGHRNNVHDLKLAVVATTGESTAMDFQVVKVVTVQAIERMTYLVLSPHQLKDYTFKCSIRGIYLVFALHLIYAMYMPGIYMAYTWHMPCICYAMNIPGPAYIWHITRCVGKVPCEHK